MRRSENPKVDDLESRHRRNKTLGRIRNELAFEIVFLAIGAALAIGLTTKIMLAVVITCLKFAIPHFITGWLILKHDPDPWHGRALALLFVAMGFFRASFFAFSGLIAGVFLMLIVFGRPVGQFANVGFGTGFLCAYGFLAIIFPLALCAACIAWRTGKKLEFAAGLTKLRRNEFAADKEVTLDVWESLKLIGIASGISLSISLILPLTVSRNPIFFVAAFISPFVWMHVFWSITKPRK